MAPRPPRRIVVRDTGNRPMSSRPTNSTSTTQRRSSMGNIFHLAARLFPLPHMFWRLQLRAQTQQRSQYPARRPIPSTAPPPDRLRVTTEAHVSKRKVADALGDLVPVWPSALSPSGLLPGRLLHLTSHQSPVTIAPRMDDNNDPAAARKPYTRYG
ncbi:unnamed protein product [Miscanthus lutarioriparius]|uniref:Uncharacterized protein n=1 Tax=Miscanthus lutarioriparius TaxID=422564 RepID=A0A811MWE5_9POAL|nr:unnamed protein product [Miscanthus lutarioriparius]